MDLGTLSRIGSGSGLLFSAKVVFPSHRIRCAAGHSVTCSWLAGKPPPNFSILLLTSQRWTTHQQQDDSASLLLTRNFFLLHVHGTVEGVAFPGEDYDHLRCKVLFRFGPGLGAGWRCWSRSSVTKQTPSAAAAAPSVFLSQTAVRAEDGQQQKLLGSSSQQSFVWNLPLEATFQSTNVFGWPQVVVTVYSGSADGSFGSSETIRGYGWAHLPTRPGVHRLILRLFRPQASTALGRLSSWLGAARAPEFVDARLAAGAEGRSLVAVANTGGQVTLCLSLLLKDFKKYGFVSR
ncbi:B9 domain-containing protein 1 [Tyrophagus putrescentiae]|nr:B9 domain-containing protein 1 [Tyrophagus putrescentiae]